ncbi:MAG: hypothetical protein QOG23_1745 [Blastocatellia bacterium]|jgi:hypothetical protein|nr:hypothetical protein [Blastocatellia bacterium]
MKNSRIILLHLIILIASFALVGSSQSSLAQDTTPAASPTPGLTADQKKKVSDVQEAIKGADSAITQAESRRRTASAHADRIKSLVASRKADDAALRDLEDLTDIVGDVADAKFYLAADADQPALKDLVAAETKLKTASDALPASPQPDEIETARTNAGAAKDRLAAEKKAVSTTRDDLNVSVKNVYEFADTQSKALITSLEPLTNLAKNEATTPATEEALRKALLRQMSTLRQTERLSRDFQNEWGDLKAKLALIKPPPDKPTVDSIDGTITTVRTNLKAIVKALLGDGGATTAKPGWLGKVAQKGKTEADIIITKRNEVRSDPPKNSAIAVQTLRDDSPLMDDIRGIHTAWIGLTTQLVETDDLGFDSVVADDAANQLNLSVRAIKGALADLQDALTGDFSNFQADQVSLFYFSDVPRLMQILNPETYEVGGIRSASEEAASQRRSLTNAELDLADAQSEVNAAQQRVVALREELRQSQAAAASTNQIFKKTGLGLKSAQRDKEINDKRFTDAQCDPVPTDPDKRANCERIANDRDRANARVGEADQRNKDADEERKTANERNDALKDEQSGLPAKIAAAESKLETAQTGVNRQRRSALLAAQAESEAFVKARDNRPFWFAPAIASSTDPAKHVIMWAFNDSKTIFLRGKPADLNAVKCIISKVDQPAPQARMTLWTLELSSDASTSGTLKANKAFELIDRRLSSTRALNAGALSLLRDVINENVNIVAQGVLIQNKPAGAGGAAQSADDFRLARLRFYSDEILYRLGFRPDQLFDRTVTDPDIAKLIVPDPAGTTTLGEALMVLSLGKKEYRNKIITDFAYRLTNYLRGLGLTDLPPELQQLDARTEPRKSLELNWFPSLRRVLNLDAVSVPVQSQNVGSGGLSAAQLEIVHAMEEVAKDRLLKYAAVLYSNVGRKEGEIRAKRKELSDKYPALKSNSDVLNHLPPCPKSTILLGPLAKTVSQEDQRVYGSLELEYCHSAATLLRVVQSLENSGVSWERLRAAAETRMKATDDATANEAEDKWNKLIIQESCTSPLRIANAREAAADQMLKDMIIAVEDDLDRTFVQPMLSILRKDLVSKAGIGVGIVQRTSVLATNRLLARVDPRASAQLAVGQTTDVLQAAQQLSQIFFAAQSGGALGALGALKSLPQKPQTELYGLTTGNVFQVTPIFDPSGQALRFKFDYVESSQIREPNGTVNPQLPRIERHTVNTEVQLSNLELREISRFESNSRLGIATRYAGGLPLLKDLPYIRYIPLIGWFVRTSGKAAVTQQSLMFGQTTMYPTIGDIMGLLTSDVNVGITRQ